MAEELHEECGIAAVFFRGNTVNSQDSFLADDAAMQPMVTMYKVLLNLQNRGQLSCGISSFDAGRDQLLKTFRRLGSVNEVFRISDKSERIKLFSKYSGSKMIGHVRYATCGRDDVNYAQPFERMHGRKWKWFSFCFNGQLANYAELKKTLMEKTDYHITRDTDTEIIMHYIARELKGNKKPNLVQVFANLSKKFDGAWNIAFMNGDGDMVVARDPYGFRPLCYGMNGNIIIAASESNALINCGIEDIRPLQPGEMLIIQGDDLSVRRFAPARRKAHCMFEYVYFSNVASNLDGRSVYMVRTNLGNELAKLEVRKLDNDSVIIAVPDTAKPAGDAFAYSFSRMPREGLLRNRYVGRTFIEGESREDKVRNKYTALREILEGKKVFLVDDSIVRGTTLKRLILYLRETGKASEVHVRVSCPPIMSPCFYGIDMSTVSELFAPRYADKLTAGKLPQEALNRMAHDIGADSLIYQSVEGLIKAIGLPRDKLCLACIDSNYITPAGRDMYKKAQQENGAEKKRTYE
jgi:amidophosphoribosyltransferase